MTFQTGASPRRIAEMSLLLFALVSVAVGVQERFRQNRRTIAATSPAITAAIAVETVASSSMQPAPANDEGAGLVGQVHWARPPTFCHLPKNWPTIGELRDLYDAIYAEETASGKNLRDGDGGKSRGPYQIQRVHWTDSGLGEKGEMGLPYEPFCRNKMVSECEMYGYWRRRCPAALRARDYETLARYHNGGPELWCSANAGDYWRRVKEHLRNPCGS
jgi:hypothetical protein